MDKSTIHQLHRDVIEARLPLSSVSTLESVRYITSEAAKEGIQKFKFFSLARQPAVFCWFLFLSFMFRDSNQQAILGGKRCYCAVKGCRILWVFHPSAATGWDVGHHEHRSLFHQNAALQEACADSRDRDAVLIRHLNNFLHV